MHKFENFGHVCSWLSRAKAAHKLEYDYKQLALRLGCVHHQHIDGDGIFQLMASAPFEKHPVLI
jgi:hypothetical protein